LETVCREIMPVQIDPRHDCPPRAAMASHRLGELAIRKLVGGDHVYVRDEQDVRRGDPDTVQIGMPRGGVSLLIQDGREAVLHPGHMVLYDSARPFTLVMEERFNWQVFLLPKSKLRRSESELGAITAIAIPTGAGITGLVHQFLSQLATDVAALENAPTAAALGENATDLIATLVQSQLGLPSGTIDHDAVLRERVRSFINVHHADPALQPREIARVHGVSVRRLHQIFSGTGTTVMDLVRTKRLDALRRDLMNPHMISRTISQLATAHGFASATVCARQFRAAFGLSPREFRAQGTSDEAAVGANLASDTRRKVGA